MSRFILALDQGTTSSRAILFDRAGNIHGIAQRPFPQHFPQPGWVEHNANDIWQSQLAVAQEVLRKHQISAHDVDSIGITNQRETTVLWDRKTGEAVGPAIVWQDRRTADLCDHLKAQGHEALFRRKTGLLLDPYFSGTKLAWLLSSVPTLRARAERGELAFGTVDSWLIFKLSGRHVTDVSNASRTLLFDIHQLKWDAQLLETLDIPGSLLPDVVDSSGIAAETDATHFGKPIPIAGIAGDQQAATFGQTCFAPGTAKNTYGTGCFMLLNTGVQPCTSFNNLITTVGWRHTQQQASYMLEGSVFMAGAIVQWLRDELGFIQRSEEIEALASRVSDTANVMFVPAFNGLGAPYWDPHARGTLLGMTRGTQAAHIARAALESIAYQSADLMLAMQKDAPAPLLELRVDGGASRNDLLMQFQADLLDVCVVRPTITETTALGAAYLAGLATGFWQSQDEIASLWQVERRFEPAMSSDEREARLRQWHRAIERSRSWAEEA